MDADEIRQQSVRAWAGAAAGWARRQEVMRSATAPVSQWMVEAIDPQPGQRVLELAAGLGETGFMAAELIAPGGRLICSDRSEEMLTGARARAAELGLENVEFKVIDAEWIDLPLAAVDAVLCRWGVMLMADGAAAMRECRRVLRPGGRMAMAAWIDPQANAWASGPAAEMVARGHLPPPEPDAPGMFALGDPQRLESLLADAGFTEIEVAPLDFAFAFASLDDWWETQLDLSPALRPTLESLPAAEAAATQAAIVTRIEEHVGGDGALVLPARTLVAAATA